MNVQLKSHRKNAGLTQDAVARYLDTTVQSYNKKELGQRRVSLNEAQRLARLFNTTIEALFPEKPAL